MEMGLGRSDICLTSKSALRPHIVIEFKQGENISRLKEEALGQIIEQKYFSLLNGKVLCLGIAHDKKACEIAYKMIEL
jgi:PD-(D/E)XK nuclease superfamily